MTDISGSNLLNLKTRQYDQDLLALYGLGDIRDALPPLKGSFDNCGAVTAGAAAQTELREGTVVAGGMFDIDACAIAMDIPNDENLAVIAGTWSINEYIAKQPVLNKSVMMNSLYCINGYYLIEECSATSAGNLAWFKDYFLPDIPDYKTFDKLAAEIPPAESTPLFLPFLYGSNYNPRAKASLIGMDSHHTRGHVARAVLY